MVHRYKLVHKKQIDKKKSKFCFRCLAQKQLLCCLHKISFARKRIRTLISEYRLIQKSYRILMYLPIHFECNLIIYEISLCCDPEVSSIWYKKFVYCQHKTDSLLTRLGTFIIKLQPSLGFLLILKRCHYAPRLQIL